MNRREIFKFAAAPTGAVIAFLFAPVVDCTHPPSNLTTFFATCAQVFATFFIALALLSSLPALSHLRFRQLVGRIALLYLSLGLIAATAGTLDTWPHAAYQWLFALTVGAGLGNLLTLALLGAENIRNTSQEDAKKAAMRLPQSDGLPSVKARDDVTEK